MYLYEDVIVKDLNSLFTNSKVCAVVASSLDEGLKRIAAKNEDEITLPAILVTSRNWQLNDVNYYSLMHGSEFKRLTEEEDSRVKSTNIIPFTPSYTMYVLAQSSRECDMLTREIIFHYFQNPTLALKIPYGINELHTFNILFDSNISKSETMTGLVYRTLDFSLQGAYLWHNNTFNYVKSIKTNITSKYDE